MVNRAWLESSSLAHKINGWVFGVFFFNCPQMLISLTRTVSAISKRESRDNIRTRRLDIVRHLGRRIWVRVAWWVIMELIGDETKQGKSLKERLSFLPVERNPEVIKYSASIQLVPMLHSFQGKLLVSWVLGYFILVPAISVRLYLSTHVKNRQFF